MTDGTDTAAYSTILTSNLGSKILGDAEFYVNIKQGFIFTTEDKVRLALGKYFDARNQSRRWETPLAICLTLLVALVTVDFKTVGLTGAVWQALFILGACLSGFYALWFWWHSDRLLGLDAVVQELKKGQLPREAVLATATAPEIDRS